MSLHVPVPLFYVGIAQQTPQTNNVSPCRGVSVLNQKTELQKAMEKHNDKKVLKEIQKEKEAALTPFQKALDERAQRIEQVSHG